MYMFFFKANKIIKVLLAKVFDEYFEFKTLSSGRRHYHGYIISIIKRSDTFSFLENLFLTANA